MAVESYHLNLFSPQLIIDRELAKAMESQPELLGNGETELIMPFSASIHPSDFFNRAPALSDSGLTVAGAAAAGVSKKRSRESPNLLADDLSSYVHQEMLDLDCLLNHYTEKVHAELVDRQRWFTRQLAITVEDVARKRLKEKDEEIERVRRLNWGLEDRVRSLAFENQMWRELAQANEATADLLRTKLEQVLATQLRIKDEQLGCVDSTRLDDVESCCCGESDDRDLQIDAAARARACWICSEKESTVLLLPCRHLCLCSACGPATNFCPICKCSKRGSVNVNLS